MEASKELMEAKVTIWSPRMSRRPRPPGLGWSRRPCLRRRQCIVSLHSTFNKTLLCLMIDSQRHWMPCCDQVDHSPQLNELTPKIAFDCQFA